MRVKSLWIMLLLLPTLGWAALDVELTKGVDSAIPLAVVPFAWESQNGEPRVDISQVIADDLANSGEFTLLDKSQMRQQPHVADDVDYSYWRGRNIDNVVVGRIQPLSSGKYKVEFTLLNVYGNSTHMPDDVAKDLNTHWLLSQTVTVSPKDARRLAHQISDLIYEKLTGEKGVFSTRLAYVIVDHKQHEKPHYRLEVSDVDGYNAKAILRSDEPIMSPAWSPNGKKIAYVSFEGKRAKIYVSDVASGERTILTRYEGINGAPAWSPDGRHLAVSLSLGASPNIYVVDLLSKKLRQLTDDSAINTEPNWSPDGQSIVFTSDRGGAPQIYRMDLRTKKISRLTYEGRYNARASFLPDGKAIVVLHRADRGYNIALLDLWTGKMRTLTHTGMDESPSVAPNGKMVVYATHDKGQGMLAMVSMDGRVRLRLPDQQGYVQEPVWSPFLT